MAEFNRPGNYQNVRDAAESIRLKNQIDNEDDDSSSNSSPNQDTPEQGGIGDQTVTAVAEARVSDLPTDSSSGPRVNADGPSVAEVAADASSIGGQAGSGRAHNSTDLDVFNAISGISGDGSVASQGSDAIADGSDTYTVIVETDSNGNQTTTDPHGSVTTEFSAIPGLSKTTTFSGASIWEFPNGVTVVEHANGDTDTYYPDGSYEGKSGDETVTANPDGSTTTTHADGTTTTTHPDGSTTRSHGSSEGETSAQDEEESDSSETSEEASDDDEDSDSDGSNEGQSGDESDQSDESEAETETPEMSVDPSREWQAPLPDLETLPGSDAIVRGGRNEESNPTPDSGAGDDPIPQQVIDMMPVQQVVVKPGVSDPPEGETETVKPVIVAEPIDTMTPNDDHSIDYGPDYVDPREGEAVMDYSNFAEIGPNDGTEKKESEEGQNTLGDLFTEASEQATGSDSATSTVPTQVAPIIVSKAPVESVDLSRQDLAPSNGESDDTVEVAPEGGDASAETQRTSDAPATGSGERPSGEIVEAASPDVITSIDTERESTQLPTQINPVTPGPPVANIVIDTDQVAPPTSEGPPPNQQYVEAPPDAGQSSGETDAEDEDASTDDASASTDGVESSLDVIDMDQQEAPAEEEQAPSTEGEAEVDLESEAETDQDASLDEPIDFTVDEGTAEESDAQTGTIEIDGAVEASDDSKTESTDTNVEETATVDAASETYVPPIPDEPAESSDLMVTEPIEEEPEDDLDP